MGLLVEEIREAFRAVSQQVGPAILKICPQEERRALTLIKHAELARTTILKYAKAMAQKLDLDDEDAVKMGQVKTVERILQKAAGRYDGDIDKVTDICRERLLVNSVQDIRDLRNILNAGTNGSFNKQWAEKGVEIQEVEDYFMNPSSTGFRGINIKLKVDLGKGRNHTCELQVIHREMEKTYDTTHSYYEHIRMHRELAASQKRDLSPFEAQDTQELLAESKRLHTTDAINLGLTQLQAVKFEMPAPRLVA